MALFLLEALLALVILIGIVWWTMFSGRHKGELPPPETPPESPSGPDPKDRDRP
jgi:cytoskeletal protein RodZ